MRMLWVRAFKKQMLFLCAALCLTLSANALPYGMTGLALTETSLMLEPEESVQLTPYALPEGTALPQLTYASSDERVVRVQPSGTITGVDGGTAVITASTSGGEFTAQCTVVVTPRESSQNSGWILLAEGSVVVILAIAFAIAYRRFLRKKNREEMENL